MLLAVADGGVFSHSGGLAGGPRVHGWRSATSAPRSARHPPPPAFAPFSLHLVSVWSWWQRWGRRRVRRDKTASIVPGERKWLQEPFICEKKGLQQKCHTKDSG